MTDERCETCRFWKRDEHAVKAGRCRRFPPFTRWDREWLFPFMAAGDWCGEYKPNGMCHFDSEGSQT